MKVQPTSQNITNKTTNPINNIPTMNSYYVDANVSIINPLEEIKKQKDVKNTLLLIITGVLSLGTLLVPASILLKGSGGGSGKKLTQSLAGLPKGFESLAKDQKIPTLDTCKSINKKLKKFLQEQVNYANANKGDIERTGIPKPANMLLMYGPPGTGKTFFSKLFAKTLGADYAEVKFADFNSVWCGEHIENLKGIMNDILTTATTSPKKKFVVTFNEIDAILQPAEKMSQSKGSFGMAKSEERATILTYIDEILEKAPNVTIIGTTNLTPKGNQLDGAAMSRFKNLIEVSYPDKDCLFEALKAHLEKMDKGKEFVTSNKAKIEKLAEKMTQRKSSFRDLDNVVDKSKNAYLEAYMKNKNAEYKFQYLEDALNNIDLTDGERNVRLKLDICA